MTRVLALLALVILIFWGVFLGLGYRATYQLAYGAFTQILVRGVVARLKLERAQQRDPRVIVAMLRGVQYGEVVGRFGQRRWRLGCRLAGRGRQALWAGGGSITC